MRVVSHTLSRCQLLKCDSDSIRVAYRCALFVCSTAPISGLVGDGSFSVSEVKGGLEMLVTVAHSVAISTELANSC